VALFGSLSFQRNAISDSSEVELTTVGQSNQGIENFMWSDPALGYTNLGEEIRLFGFQWTDFWGFVTQQP
jgi:hypothetical protein